ncbi:PLP-dependent aspartate aminotransferase family protein [Thioalkalivibrio sp. ALE11]|uniref:trans-sulfuration enzyme family protein n=1 Tax=Thioalkalivibrio sp. ALE11 TaxID=1265494 RepID=UPI0003716A26|nr:aminotransferase class I/II-fold pyridoxal phosphate-dependent enzyme [Thioalkalivibrio sp. ALE11]
MAESDDRRLSTRCIHAGEIGDAHGSALTPIYPTTTFKYRSTAAILDVVEGRTGGSLYTRYGMNPTIRSVESKLASLEGAEAALVFSSGMAAETALFLALGREGVVCIGDAYGGTMELLSEQLPQLGIRTQFLLGDELDRLDACLEQGAGLVFLETPTNPALEVFPIGKIAERAHAHGALLAVDNTFASPVNQNPLALGADLVSHSATKYLGGHSDLTAGALMGSTEHIGTVAGWRKNLGSTPSPETCAQLARSLHTLVVRVRHQNASARAIAEAMQGHPKVTRVRYPGLPEDPGHALACEQMHGFGGMLTLELDADTDGTSAVVDRLRLFAIAPSLGGTESLVTQPVTTTHHGVSPEERERRGITGSMVRLSVGLEDPQDLIDDLCQALG